jgi:hypothetical protein
MSSEPHTIQTLITLSSPASRDMLVAEREAEIAAMRAAYPYCVRKIYAAEVEAELRSIPLVYRTMASAPQDGSCILINCYWEPLTVVGKFKDGDWVVAWDEASLALGFEATHWTYLPEDKRNG